VDLPDGARQIRQYSLSCAPGSPVRTITVKRIHGPAAAGPDGEVSNHLHAAVAVGDTLRVSAPYGDLVLRGGAAPVLLASAGIGCTPMLSMLEHLAETGHPSPVTVLHADRSPADHALRADHRALTYKLADGTARFWYEADAEPGDGEGLMDLADVAVAPGTRAYLCGPLPFMRAVRAQLLAKGVPAADIHYEVFGPDLWLASA
jgi:nitric oxide dioxygenase